MKQPKPVVPLFQIVQDRLFRKPSQLPQTSPLADCAADIVDLHRLPLGIYPSKYPMEHRQQQPQNRHILGGQLPRQIGIRLGLEQCLAQRNFLHPAIGP